MTTNGIRAGKVYTDNDDLHRYVVDIIPAEGQKQVRVKWRRPGRFTIRLETQTMSNFLKSIFREDKDFRVEAAPKLPNDGMAVTE